PHSWRAVVRPSLSSESCSGFGLRGLRCVFPAFRGEHIEIDHGLVADDFAPMRHIGRYDDEAAWPDVVHLVADVEAQRPGHDVSDLLMRMAVRLRLVSRHQAMQSDGGGVAG